MSPSYNGSSTNGNGNEWTVKDQYCGGMVCEQNCPCCRYQVEGLDGFDVYGICQVDT